jgi:cbb3-type cytochrome oxidase subunit 3
MDIEAFLEGAHLWSLVVVAITFALILGWALWPGMQKNFDEAAHLPLNED